jgi:DNA repair protein RecN (Recombination protein N)
MLRSNFPLRSSVLAELRVENYAVIDQLAVEFAPGLNLLTGETGAGKSILIDALALLLGEKASSDVIRHGAEKATISAVFAADAAEVDSVLESNGLDASDEGAVIVRREIAAGGKGRVFVNNQPATVAVLRQLAPRLAVIHAQNESILSFDAASRLDLLDNFAGADRTDVAAAFAAWRELRVRLAELERDEQERLRMADLWRFQRNEIESARLLAGEDERLESEKRLLANAEKVYGAAMSAYDLLYENAASAASSLRTAARHIEELSRMTQDERFREALADLESARISVEDVSSTLRDYADGIDASPERLGEVEDRLATIDRLKRKYGSTLQDVIGYGEEVARTLSDIENRDELLAGLRREMSAAAERYLSAARALSRQRNAAARELEKLVESEVNELAMRARFRVEAVAEESPASWGESGIDSVAYLISTNAGQPLGPVEKIASGGELSRVMLALKTSVERGRAASGNGKRRKRSEVSARSLVFDEIDSGIGGRAADAVGKKLKELAQAHQVLCVTHLPQIASFANQHYLIAKRETGGTTRTSIRLLSATERTEEVARMLSGAKLTDTSLKHAEQLLKANA